KVCGNAFYNICGLTYQESLNKFWKAAKKFKINQNLFERFRSYLIDNVQINGSFYGKLAAKCPPPSQNLKPNFSKNEKRF
ncbi:capsular polysaccharide export protein, LipB/KpsS family, partial [Helicobacter pullorum]